MVVRNQRVQENDYFAERLICLENEYFIGGVLLFVGNLLNSTILQGVDRIRVLGTFFHLF